MYSTILIYNFPRAAGRHVLQDTVRPVVLSLVSGEAVAIRDLGVVAGRRLVLEVRIASIQVVVETCVGKRSVWTERARCVDGVEVEPDRGSASRRRASMEPPQRRRRVARGRRVRTGRVRRRLEPVVAVALLSLLVIALKGNRAMGLKPKNGEDGLLYANFSGKPLT